MSATKRVLVVDDEEQVLFVISRALSRMGSACQVQTADNGQQALKMAQGTPFDLVITDLLMPDMDGVALTQALRDLDRGLKVIWITAYNCCTQAAEMARLGVQRCLDKPIEIGEIRRVVSQVLWGHE